MSSAHDWIAGGGNIANMLRWTPGESTEAFEGVDFEAYYSYAQHQCLSLRFTPDPQWTTAAVSDELRLYHGWIGEVEDNDFWDTKRQTTGTGGAERRYIDKLLGIVCKPEGPDYSGRAFAALLSWNEEQTLRPWSWDGRYSKGDLWVDGSGPGTPTPEGRNRVDLAHASRSQHYALALLGHPLGILNLWMETRVLMNDLIRSIQTGGNPFGQPRSIAWALIALQRCINVGITQLPFASLGLREVAPLRDQLLLDCAIQMSREYPDDKAMAGQKTDGRVLPQCKDGTLELAGEYTFQYGFVCWAMAYLRHFGVRGALTRAVQEFFRRKILRNYVAARGWAWGTGTTPFPTLTAAEERIAVAKAANPKDDSELLIATHPDRGYRVIKTPDFSDFELFHAPLKLSGGVPAEIKDFVPIDDLYGAPEYTAPARRP
jgi:hypothetical protein